MRINQKVNNLNRSLKIAFAMVLILAWCTPMALAAGLTASSGSHDKASNARNGVVRILSEGERSCGLGSGFGIGKAGKPTQYFITNWHVVEDGKGGICENVYLMLDDETFTDQGFDASRAVRCEVLGEPVEYPDFAILKAERVVTERIALPLVSSEILKPMDNIYTIGYPAAADYDSAVPASIDHVTSHNGTVDKIESVPFVENTLCILHNAHINHGNSGGPLVTEDGAAVGINTYGWEAKTQGSTSNFYASVPIDYVMSELDRLGISYDTYQPSLLDHIPVWFFVLVGVVIIGGGAVLFIVVNNNKQQQAVLAGMNRGMKDAEQRMKDAERRVKEAERQAQEAWKAAQKAMEKTPVESRRSNGTVLLGKDSGLRLQSLGGVYQNKRFAIGEKVSFGVLSQNSMPYPQGCGVSRQHCQLFWYKGKLYLVDLGSTNGTYLGNTRLTPKKPVPVKVGDTFSLAGGKERFRIERSSRK